MDSKIFQIVGWSHGAKGKGLV